jgi:PRTRC genetic system protein B
MMFGVDMTGDETLKLGNALLFYTGPKSHYATFHNVAIGDKGATLLSGKPLTQSAVCRVFRDFIGSTTIGGFIPENVLSIGVDSVVWWRKPSPRRVFFKAEKIGEKSKITPHPGLVFVTRGSEWYVFAVKGKDRPTPQTELYQAPYFNVWHGGKICTGNVSVPKGNIPDTIRAWESAFFDSTFTHPNVKAPDKLVAYRGGSYSFWKALLNGKRKTFPEKALVSFNEKLILSVILTNLQGGK